jgi:hypothetical protein
MLYSIFFISLYGFLVLLRQGIARGSPPGTTTEVQRVGFPSAEIRFVSVVAVSPRRQEAVLQPLWPRRGPQWLHVANRRGPRWLVFLKLTRENTNICNGMYGASTLTKHLMW